MKIFRNAAPQFKKGDPVKAGGTYWYVDKVVTDNGKTKYQVHFGQLIKTFDEADVQKADRKFDVFDRDNAKTNALNQGQKDLAELVQDKVALPTERDVINIALDNGYSRADADAVWREFWKEMRSMDNDLDPKDRATVKELKEKLAKASDEMDDHPGAASYEAAFKAAQKQYDDFLDTVGTKTNALLPDEKAEYDRLNKEWQRLEDEITKEYKKIEELEKQLAEVKNKTRAVAGNKYRNNALTVLGRNPPKEKIDEFVARWTQMLASNQQELAHAKAKVKELEDFDKELKSAIADAKARK